MASTIVQSEKTKKKCGLKRLPRIATVTNNSAGIVKMTTLGIQDNLGLLVLKQKKLEVSFRNPIKFKD